MNSSRGREQTIAYFSMEIALEPALPTYSGGLGVLAGDTIRAAADRNFDPTAPVTGDRTPHDASSLYDKLENTIIPLFYKDRNAFH